MSTRQDSASSAARWASSLIDVAPLARLLSAPRAALGALAIAAWTIGFGWIGLALRFNSATDRTSDADFAPLLVAAGLVMLPLALGALASEAAHEVLRRPTTFVLPGVRRRLRASTWLLAAVASTAAALGFAPLHPTLSAGTALAPALLGFSVGAWAMVRVGGAIFLFLRVASVAALAGFAAPLCGAAREPLIALALFALAALLLTLRFRAPLARASLFSPAQTFFTAFSARRTARGATSEGDGAAACEPRTLALPPERLGGSVAGWLAARRFEQSTTRSGIGTPGGAVRFALFATAVALVGPFVSALVDREPLLVLLADALVGLPAVATGADDGVRSIVIVLGMLAGMSAWVACAPLLGDFLYPVSRRTRGRLAWRVGAQVAFVTAAATLVAGALVGGALVLGSGAEWPRTLPVFAWAALANLLVAPWIQLGLHAAGQWVSERPSLFAGALLIGGLMVPAFALAELHEKWDGLVAGVPPLALLAGYGAALAAGFAVLRLFLARHFATCTLVRD